MLSEAMYLLIATFAIAIVWNVTLGVMLFLHVKGEAQRQQATVEKTLIAARGEPRDVAHALNLREQNQVYMQQHQQVFQRDLNVKPEKKKKIIVDRETGHQIEIDEVM